MMDIEEDSLSGVEVIKAPNDKKEYKLIRLENGLIALLVSNPRIVCDDTTDVADNQPLEDEAENSGDRAADQDHEDQDDKNESDDENENISLSKNKAAVALCIGAGSFCDPDSLPGLAHLLEHMVCMGSEKYPYKHTKFLAKRGGISSATTECEHTVFKMAINPKFLKEALDHFAQIFIAPLMKEEFMEQAIKDIDREFQRKIKDFYIRCIPIIRSLAKDGHPIRKFMWGNMKSLKEDPESMDIDVHEQLLGFWEKYYSANIMTMAVESSASLDELEMWTRDIFSAIPNNELSPPDFSHRGNPFDMYRFNKIVKVVSAENINLLVISWILPSLVERYRSKPLGYLAWLVRQKGPGSLVSYFEEKEWTPLVSARGGYYSMCSFFEVIIPLRESGMDHLFDILTCVFEYLAMLREEGPQKWIYDELKHTANMMFNIGEENDPLGSVEELATCMRYYLPEHYVCGTFVFDQYDEDLIKECQDQLTADKANVMVISNQHDPTETTDDDETYEEEPWTKTQYRIDDIPEEWLQVWLNPETNPAFHLPPENEFVPTDYTIKEADAPESLYPVKYHEDEYMRLFYKKDSTFNVPIAGVYLHLISPEILKSPDSYATCDLFVALLEESLKDIMYAAATGFMSYELSTLSSGISITVFGCNHKIPVLLNVIIERFMELDPNDEMFEEAKKDLSESYKTFTEVDELSTEILHAILREQYFTSLEKYTALQAITKEHIHSFINAITSQMFIEALCQGNITSAESMEMLQMVRSKLECQPFLTELIPRPKAVILPEGSQVCRVLSFNPREGRSMVTNYYQMSTGDTAEFCLAEIMIRFMSEYGSEFVGTEEEPGLIADCHLSHIGRLMGFYVTVNNPADTYNCSHIDRKIDDFLTRFAERIQASTEEEFQELVESLIKKKSSKDEEMKQEIDRNFRQITDFEYRFDQLARDIEFLSQEITLDGFKEWCLRYLSPNAEERKKLSIQVVGRGKAALEECKEWVEDSSIAPIPECHDTDDEDNDEDDAITYHMIFLTPVAEDEDDNDSTPSYVTDVAEFKANLELYVPSVASVDDEAEG